MNNISGATVIFEDGIKMNILNGNNNQASVRIGDDLDDDDNCQEYSNEREALAEDLYRHEEYRYYREFCHVANIPYKPAPPDFDRLIKALRAFDKAYTELNLAWSDGDIETLNNLDAIHDYPFQTDFCELGVSAWVNESVEELEKLRDMHRRGETKK